MDLSKMLGHIRELHFKHDPATGSVQYEALVEFGGETARYRATGQYRSSVDAPKVEIGYRSDVVDHPLGDCRPVLTRNRGRLSLESDFEVLEMVREILAREG